MMRRSLHLLILQLLFIIIIVPPLAAASAVRIQLEHADTSRFTFGTEETIYTVWGNVHFTCGESDLKADSAVWYERQNRIELYNNVVMIEPQRSLVADTVFYDKKSGIVNAFGNVVIKNLDRHVRIDGGRAVIYEHDESLTMSAEPKLILDFDLPTIPTVILADTIIFDSRENIVTAIDSVRIRQGSLEAASQQAVFYPDKEEFCLTGEVKASQRNNRLAGDEMMVYSKKKVLQRIEVTGSGEAIFKQRAQADTLVFNESRLTAAGIDFFFSDDRLNLIKAAGNSYTYYNPAREDTVAKGSNVASGDSTILYFVDSKINKGLVITSAEGLYTTPLEYDSLGHLIKEDSVRYQANRVRFEFDSSLIYLEEAARVRQANIDLEADRIRYDLRNKIVDAQGYFDSTRAKYIPLTLRDGGDEITGERLAYDLNDKRGKIKKSRTQVEQAYYGGDILRKEEENVLLVCGGSYTTCDLEHPHYHFKFHNMKLQTGDKVFARPVVLYIETVPVLVLPYFVFSTKKGRHSGFLPFRLGNFERGRRFVNNIGYYWAVNDYWDIATSVDVHEEFGLKFNTSVRYALRYKLSGNVSASYSRETGFLGYKRVNPKRWHIGFSHNQTIDPSLTLRGSGNFVSDASYYTDFSTDPSKRLNRQMRSQLNISKRWEGASLTAAVDQTKDLDRNSHSEKLPTISFSRPSRPFFASPKEAVAKRWYHSIYYSYRASFTNTSSKSVSDDEPTRKKQAVFGHDISLRAPQKVMNALTVSPGFTLRDYWYYLPYSDQAVDDSIATNTLKNRQIWSSSLGLSTNLYGTVAPNVLTIVGLRHVISPSASFSYQPEFTRNEEYAAFTGAGRSGSERKSVSFSLRNQFQMKYVKDEQERKATLLNFNISASHNFVKEQRRWSDISTTLRSPSVKNFTLQITMRHDPYNPETGQLRWWSPYLKSISISSGYSGSINFTTGSGGGAVADLLGKSSSSQTNTLRFGISQRYSESRGATYTSISHWIDFNLQFSPSRNWRIKYSQNYNLRLKESTSKVIEIYRDLHCWEGSFSWIPTGSRKGYYFKINAKLLPDLKFEKSESGIRDALF